MVSVNQTLMNEVYKFDRVHKFGGHKSKVIVYHFVENDEVNKSP